MAHEASLRSGGQRRVIGALGAILLGIATAAGSASAQGEGGDPEVPPGRAVYEQYCAACHSQPPADSKAPALAELRQMSQDTLRLALTQGPMQAIGATLPRPALRDVIEYLAVQEVDDGSWLAAMTCDAKRAEVSLKDTPTLAMFGTDPQSTRQMTAKEAGLGSEDLEKLELAWAIGFPKTTGLRSSPVIVGTTMFYAPVQTGKLLALDIGGEKPCVEWVYDGGTQLRTSVSIGPLEKGGPPALVFADRRGQVHAVDAKTGKGIWKAEGRHTRAGQITGSPVMYEDRIIVPVSASGVGRGAQATYECCEEHGAVVALEAKTGKQVWTYHTMEDAKYTGKTSRTGVKLRGPSGAPIWSTPTIDAKRKLVYATTGQNTSLPATPTSDAVIALDLATGKEKWVFQAVAKDVWNIACRVPWERSGPNCPSPEESVLKDHDFGGAALLTKGKEGKDIVIAGQKSGDVWAIDPDTGKQVWHTRFGSGSELGGVHWGLATDGERVFAPLNDPVGPAREGEGTPEPGMNAIDIATGETTWRQPVTADCSESRKARFANCAARYGLSAAPLVVDRSVIAGSVDGRIYVYDGKTGKLVFQYDTLRDFETVNGVPGKGGSIDSHSVFAGNGMLFVASGYAQFRQPPGNVLLAFRPKRD